MTDEVKEVRARIDIVDLIGQTVALKRAGKNYKGLCPFHQDHNPSFDVNPNTGRFTCWACGEKGDIFDWVMKTQNVAFAEALQMLAQKAGVTLKRQDPLERSIRMSQRAAMECALEFYRHALAKSPQALDYCEGRGLDADVVEKWELGYAPENGEALTAHLRKKGFRLADCKPLFLVDGDEANGYSDKFRGRLMFAIRDERGDLVGFGGRVLGAGIPKYINSGDTPLYRKSRVLYGMNSAKEAMRDSREAVLVEGFLDVIACHRADVKNAVASLGTSLTEEQAKLLKRWCDQVVILYDSDAAGQKAADRATEILGAEDLRVRVALVPEGKDPDTLLATLGPEAVQKAAKGGLSPLEFKVRALEAQLSYEDEEFWKQAIGAIAAAPSDMERTKFIEHLAGRYPELRNYDAARRALAKEVAKLRVGVKAPVRAVVTTPAKAPSPFRSQERAIFRAFLDEELRPFAWPALTRNELFETKGGAKLATFIVESFPSGPPAGAPSAWLDAVQPERARDLLLDIEADQMLVVTGEVLSEALKTLERTLERRKVQEMISGDRTDEQLLQIGRRLRELKS